MEAARPVEVDRLKEEMESRVMESGVMESEVKALLNKRWRPTPLTIDTLNALKADLQ